MNKSALKTAPKIAPKMEALPLYARVRTELINRLISGEWKPAQLLPSEFAIAAELGVSQGTVRKALDEMTAQGLVVRKQGRGTFVAEAEDQSILFRFYRLTPDAKADEEIAFPQSRYLSEAKDVATAEERAVLDMVEGDEVWRFERVRSQQDKPIIWERLVIPAAIFPNLMDHAPLPNNVYQLYGSHYGIIVAKVKEQLKAVSAEKQVADNLKLPLNAPVLQIDRRAIALSGKTVEWRLSLCRSDTHHYRNELS